MTEPLAEPRMVVLPDDAGEIAIRRGVNNPPATNGNHPDPAVAGWQRIDLTDDRYATPPAPPDLHPLIYSGLRHALSGPPEATKTLLSYAILLDIVRTGRHVAIVDFEMGANRARILLDELGATRDDLNRIHYHQDVQQPPDEEDVDELVRAGVAIVVIDSSVGAFDASGLDDNARKDVEAWAKAWIRPLFANGIATLVLDHVTKNADTRGKFTIGSERKTGGVDVHIGAEPVTALKRGGNAIVKIRTHKDRGAYLERPLAAVVNLASDPVTNHITVTLTDPDSASEGGRSWMPTVLMDRCSRYLHEHGASSLNEIHKNVKGKDATLTEALECLVDLGHASESEGIRNARMFTFVSSFEHVEKPLEASSNDLSPTSAPHAPADLRPPPPTSAPPTRGQSVAGRKTQTSTSALDEDDQAFLDGMTTNYLEELARTHTDPADQ